MPTYADWEGVLPHGLCAQQDGRAALTLGANDRNSRLRIIAEFMTDKSMEENARFLQAHYKENGAGFYMGERKYSLWYNEAGMQIAPGESALTFNATALTWEQAAERIRELLDDGKYASQAMLYRAWPFEKNRVAEALQYLHRDIDEDYKDKYLPNLVGEIASNVVSKLLLNSIEPLGKSGLLLFHPLGVVFSLLYSVSGRLGSACFRRLCVCFACCRGISGCGRVIL